MKVQFITIAIIKVRNSSGRMLTYRTALHSADVPEEELRKRLAVGMAKKFLARLYEEWGYHGNFAEITVKDQKVEMFASV